MIYLWIRCAIYSFTDTTRTNFVCLWAFSHVQTPAEYLFGAVSYRFAGSLLLYRVYLVPAVCMLSMHFLYWPFYVISSCFVLGPVSIFQSLLLSFPIVLKIVGLSTPVIFACMLYLIPTSSTQLIQRVNIGVCQGDIKCGNTTPWKPYYVLLRKILWSNRVWKLKYFLMKQCCLEIWKRRWLRFWSGFLV